MSTDNIEMTTAAELMPNDEYAQRILLKRAELLAHKDEEKTEESGLQYIRFRLGKNEYYGIPYQSAKEVMHHTIVTPLPHMPDFIAGIINRNGALLTILDLKRFFNLAKDESDKDEFIIVVAERGITLGILVNYIDGSEAYIPNALDAPLPVEGSIKPEYIIGLSKARTAIINTAVMLPQIQSQLARTKEMRQ